MKIGLNATCLNDRPSGAKQRFVGIYGQLIKHWTDHEFVIYEPVDCRVSHWFDEFPNVTARITPIPSEDRIRKHFTGHLYWRLFLKNEHLDVFERFNLPIVRAHAAWNLMTIHDIRGVYSDRQSIKQTLKRAYVGRSLNAADHVITVSESMKKEILDIYPGVPVSVIYNGVNESGFAQVTDADLTAFRQNNALPEDFMLAVGHFEKRKNYLSLMDAVSILNQRSAKCPLLIIGNDSGERKAIESRVNELGLTDMVRILSGLTDHEVRCAYKLCSLLVFPSLYEGFGIPILEAMAARRPMVLSHLPVFREITQDEGIYFPPSDVEAMADAIELGLSSSEVRTRLVEYGDIRIKDFSFSQLAGQLREVYLNHA